MTPAVAAATTTRRDVETGMLIMAVAMLMLPGIDAFAKLLSATVPPGQVALARFFFQTVLMLAGLLACGRRLTRVHLGVNAGRGLAMAGATLCFFWGLKYLPIADAIAIFFVEPLILTLLSAVFLRERIGWRRLTAIAIGFVGALIVIRPSYEVFGWAAVLPLCAAVSFATYLLLTRYAAPGGDALAMQFYAGLFGGIVICVALAFGAVSDIPILQLVRPTAGEWLMMTGVGVIATTGHIMVVIAFSRAQAGVLAPFQYLEILSATVLGLMIFDDFPDATRWFGVAVIIASGLYVFHRERKLARAG
ncbi:MAG: DMT family transporter [Rhodospirillaceae bacterium]|nr:DMT family transporter [Rhodospirillaceae bacterium]